MSGEFSRDTAYLDTRITVDGEDGYPVEPGRYRLVVSRACPWAHRAVIVRRLLGLEDALPMGIAGPTHDERSWAFTLDPGGRDPVLGIERLQEAYLARDPHYDKGITVPAIIDVPSGEVVTNGPPGRPSARRYLVGDTITEADVRLFPTLVRFAAVYHGHFKCNRNKLTEDPVLWAYARDLFQTPGFGDTVEFSHIKRHYYGVHHTINPNGIVPVGPDLSGWTAPHGRAALGGRTFGDGTSPGPPPADERVAEIS